MNPDEIQEFLQNYVDNYYDEDVDVKIGGMTAAIDESTVSIDPRIVMTEEAEKYSEQEKLRILLNSLNHEIEHLKSSNIDICEDVAKRNPHHGTLSSHLSNLFEDVYIDTKRFKEYPGLREASLKHQELIEEARKKNYGNSAYGDLFEGLINIVRFTDESDFDPDGRAREVYDIIEERADEVKEIHDKEEREQFIGETIHEVINALRTTSAGEAAHKSSNHLFNKANNRIIKAIKKHKDIETGDRSLYNARHPLTTKKHHVSILKERYGKGSTLSHFFAGVKSLLTSSMKYIGSWIVYLLSFILQYLPDWMKKKIIGEDEENEKKQVIVKPITGDQDVDGEDMEELDDDVEIVGIDMSDVDVEDLIDDDGGDGEQIDRSELADVEASEEEGGSKKQTPQAPEEFKDQYEQLIDDMGVMREVESRKSKKSYEDAYVDSGLRDDIREAFRQIKDRDRNVRAEKGRRIDKRAAVRNRSGDIGEKKIFKKKKRAERGNRQITVALDVSSSMDSKKTKIALRSLYEATEKIGDNISIVTFGYGKSDGILGRTRDGMGAEDVYEFSCSGSHTPTADGISRAIKESQSVRGKNKAIIVITDGKPNEGLDETSKKPIDDASTMVSEARKQGIRVIGMGCGKVSESQMDDMFGDKYVTADEDNMARKLVEIYKSQMEFSGAA